MNRQNTNADSPGGATTMAEARRLLAWQSDQLRGVLAELGQGNCQPRPELSEKLTEFLDTIASSPALKAELGQELQELSRLYRKAVLAAAQQKAELAENLAKLRKGRSALNAYKTNG